ncbi:MAG: 3-hydroxyacyl-CoA dehydrogenase [Bryobacterales bacterium]|nr:3-hydroxyacyl-CoA dehydrogenase [Bryobacterales bacterium]
MDLAGRVALVTGGASGLGEATARLLASGGARVAVLDRNAAQGQQVAAEIGGLACETDVASESSVAAALGKLHAEWGALHITVNCAGIATAKRMLGKEGPIALADFERVIMVNLIGTFNVCRLAAALMAKNEPDEGGERGVIVNTASIAAYEGQIGQTAYAASKAGIVGLTLPMARELTGLGIRVCAIAPGLFDTPLLQALPEKVRVELGATVPHPARLGDPAEFASLVRHLVENRYMNGEVVRLDGALRMPPR